MNATTRKITAQVATEAIANDPAAYDDATVEAVRTEALLAGVASFYTDMLPAPTCRRCGERHQGECAY